MADRNLTLALQGEDKVTVEDISSDLFTNDVGVAYVDPLAIGTNPSATIFRDGTVIGNTDYGSYTRWANGDVVAEGKTEVTGLDIAPNIGINTGNYRKLPISLISNEYFHDVPYDCIGTSGERTLYIGTVSYSSSGSDFINTGYYSSSAHPQWDTVGTAHLGTLRFKTKVKGRWK